MSEYDRLVGQIMHQWMLLYPTQEWVDAASAVNRIAVDLRFLRLQYDELKLRMEGLEK